MDRVLYDIDDKIACCYDCVAKEPDTNTRWCLERRAAEYVWQRDSKNYYEGTGSDFFDYRQWELDRLVAQATYKEALARYRKRQGDKQILAQLEALHGTSCEEGVYKITTARRRIIEAVVRLATHSGVIYCSYDGLARAAWVSPRSACTIRSELEELGVLMRIRTGGKAADGRCQSNKYIVNWNKLRDVLGIENHGKGHYLGIEQPVWRNVYYNYEGCAHYSVSARQLRRLRQRAREHAKAVMERATRGHVENITPQAMLTTVENSENKCVEQGFCAVTALKNLKNPKIFQPVRSLLSYCGSFMDKCTPLRGSLDARPEGGILESLRDTLANRPAGGPTWCFNVAEFTQASRSRLSYINPERILPLLDEIDQMTRSNPMLETKEDMQGHAEDLLHLLVDADKSLFT